MRSPDPGISLATMFSTKAPAAPAAAPPKKADGPSFEDSLSKVENRSDRVRPADRPSRADQASRAESASHLDRRDKPTEKTEAIEPTETRNEVRDVESRPDDRVSEYARASLLISQPVAESQAPTEVVAVVDSQPLAEIGEQPKPVDGEVEAPQLAEAIEETDEPIFTIQPWPLDSTGDEPYQIQPISFSESESTVSHEPTAEIAQHGDALLPVETGIVGPFEAASGDIPSESQATVIPVQADLPQAAVVTDTPGHEPTTGTVVPVTDASGDDNAGVAVSVSEPDTTVPPEISQVAATPIQQSETAASDQSKPVFDRPVETQVTPEPADSRQSAEAQPKPFEPAGRAAVDLTDQSPVAEPTDADATVQAALPVQPRVPQSPSAKAGSDVTSVARRAADTALATAGVAVTAIEEASENGSSSTGSQDLDSQAFSSLLQAQAQVTQASRGQRAGRQIDVNPTQFAEMPAEIVARARNLADNETAELEIQLDPPELGQLKIQLRRVDGEVAARITVTDPAAFELLQHELQELRENLQQSDVAFSSVDVEQDQQNGQTFDRERSGSFAREDSEPTTREAVAEQPTGSSQQTIDIRV